MATRYVSPVTGTWAANASNYFGAVRGNQGRHHAGNDLQAASGSPVVAVIGGKVQYVGNNSGYNWNAVVLGDDGYAYRYAPHAGISVKVGQRVEQGQRIGTIGGAKYPNGTTAPHLHFEVIPPTSPAYKAILAHPGQFVPTSWFGQQEPTTIDPAKFFGVTKGTNLTIGGGIGDPQKATVEAEAPPSDPFGVTDFQAQRAQNAEAPQRTLKKGDEGLDVAALQMRLANAGLYKGPIDGKFGDGTAEAVRATERAGNLKIDRGVAGPQVQGILADSLPVFPGNPSDFPGMGTQLRSYIAPTMPNAPERVADMGTEAFGFGPKLPPAALFPSGGPVPPAPIPTPYMGNGPGRSPSGPAPVAMSPTLGTKDDMVAPADPALTASNPFQMPQPWGAVADQSVDTLANRLPAPTPAVGFGLQSSKGDYVSIPRSMWTGDSSALSKTYRSPLGMPSTAVASLPASVPFGFAQAGGAGSVMNGADVSGGRNLALMGRAPVDMANANPAPMTSPAMLRDQQAARSFGSFAQGVGNMFAPFLPSTQAAPSLQPPSAPPRYRYDPLSGNRTGLPFTPTPQPAPISRQRFQEMFSPSPMGFNSIPQDRPYQVASLSPMALPRPSVNSAARGGTTSGAYFPGSVSSPSTVAATRYDPLSSAYVSRPAPSPAPLSVPGVTFVSSPAPTSKLAPSPFALGGAAAGALAPPSASPLGASLAAAGGFGVGAVPPPPKPAPPATLAKRLERAAVPLAATLAFGPLGGLAARGIMNLVNGGPLAQRVGQAISYANAAPRSNPYAASPFTPAGFAAPNFNPTSGGSIYATHNTAPGVGTYINSAGRTLGFNVNSDQRVYGNYSGGFGGFQP